MRTIHLSFRWIEHDGVRYISQSDVVKALDQLAGHLDPMPAADVRALAIKFTQTDGAVLFVGEKKKSP